MGAFGYIYVNCFGGFGFHAGVIVGLRKMNFFGQFGDHSLEREHEGWTDGPFFHLLFPLWLFRAFVFVFGMVKVYFRIIPPLVHSGLWKRILRSLTLLS